MPPSRWNLVWAVPWGLATFIIVQGLVFLPIYLIGLVAVPLLVRWGATVQRPSIMPINPPATCWANPIADILWGNKEDGVMGDPHWQENGGTIMGWFLRNPVTNMRFWPIISTKPVPSKVHFFGMNRFPEDGEPGWCFAWQEGYIGFRWQNASWGIWAGWAVNPKDSEGPPDDWRAFGYGVVLQVLRF